MMKRSESPETTRDRDELLRLLVESVKDYAIFVLDPAGRVATWNAGAERIKGYRGQDIIGKHFSVFYDAEAIAAGVCEYELEVAAREGRFEDEGYRLRSDGSRFWANVTITALRDASGTLLGFAKVTRDLTERKNGEEIQKALAAQAATLAEKARTQEFQARFLAILGHDLRNPLASMEMGSALLRQQTSEPVFIRILDRMDASSRRMTRMIEQILDLTRSRLAEGIPINPRPMDLRESISDIVDELRTAHADRTIQVQCPPLPGTWDRDRIEQVFSNLIGNAIVHGDATKPVVVDAHQKDRTAYVEIRNEGPPIPEELRLKLFDPFRRGVRESRTSKSAGLGLGLFISREIIVAHGGAIEVSSGADRTTVRVALPGSSAAAPDQ
jgi:PAS domain S-box-containing protein